MLICNFWLVKRTLWTKSTMTIVSLKIKTMAKFCRPNRIRKFAQFQRGFAKLGATTWCKDCGKWMWEDPFKCPQWSFVSLGFQPVSLFLYFGIPLFCHFLHLLFSHNHRHKGTRSFPLFILIRYCLLSFPVRTSNRPCALCYGNFAPLSSPSHTSYDDNQNPLADQQNNSLTGNSGN